MASKRNTVTINTFPREARKTLIISGFAIEWVITVDNHWLHQHEKTLHSTWAATYDNSVKVMSQ